MNSKENLKLFLEIFENERSEIKKLIDNADKIEARLYKVIEKLEDKISIIEEKEWEEKWGERE